MIIICLYSQEANYVIIVVMDNNNVVLQINERQSFQCRRTSKSHSFAVGIALIITDCKYGLRPKKLPIANIQKKNTVKWLIQYTNPDEDFENCRTRQRY
jgi:predicted type IV restriction endonuclease